MGAERGAVAALGPELRSKLAVALRQSIASSTTSLELLESGNALILQLRGELSTAYEMIDNCLGAVDARRAELGR